MRVNYIIMGEERKANSLYCPDYDKLLENAADYEEKEYIEGICRNNIEFVYNMVYVTKQKCGHYEIFQTPVNPYFNLEKKLKSIQKISEDRICTKYIRKFAETKGFKYY